MVPHTCKDGKESTNARYWVYDGRGIPLCKVCPDCEKQKLSKYDPKVLGHYDETDVDEPIEADDGYDYLDDYVF